MGEETKQEIRQGSGGGKDLTETGERTSTAHTETKRRTLKRRGGSRSSRTEAESKVEEKELLVLDSPEPKKTKSNPTAPKQGTPAVVPIEVGEIPETPKKSETKPTTKKRTTRTRKPKFDTTQIDAVLVGLSEYVSARPGMAHWKMTDKEIKSITEPLGNIIAKSEQLAKVSEHSDAIALAFATGAVMIPRLMITAQLNKEKKKLKRAGMKLAPEEKEEKKVDEKGTSVEVNRPHDKQPKHSSHDTSSHSDLSFLGSGLGSI